ncbi:ATP-binding protein, partial [Prevotella melaninogenica]|nr:ATP-binding protein [Prevotella melaninogenica]
MKLQCKYFAVNELPEFNKHTLEVLRQPLEDRH